MIVYLVQHKQNGYVHTAFTTYAAANAWVQHFNSKTSTPDVYHVIQREVFVHFSEVGTR